MTSIEIDVFRFEGQVLSEDSVNLQSTTDDELLEGDMWLADPKNSASSIEMHESWISKHEVLHGIFLQKVFGGVLLPYV